MNQRMTRKAALGKTVALAVFLCIAGAVLPHGAPADDGRCGNIRVDMNQRLDPKGDFFGAYEIRRSGSTCRTARHIAWRYIQEFGAAKSRKRIEGFTCTRRTVDAQGVYVACLRRRNFALVTFLNYVPNG
jgi:hypothetical protein